MFDHDEWIDDMDTVPQGHYVEAMRRDWSVVSVYRDRVGRFHDTRSAETYDDLIGWRKR